MDLKHKRMTALAFALIMLAVPFTIVNITPDEEDSDAIMPLLVVLGVAAAGFGAGWLLHDLKTDSDMEDEQLRQYEARALASALASGIPSTANAINNYQNIWNLTQEHWTRQCEIVASATWKANSSYDPYAVLNGSTTYLNSATMLINATNQINEQFRNVAEHVGKWNDAEFSKYYGDGKMKVEFLIGDRTISTESASDFKARLGQIVGSGNDRTVKTGNNAVYWAGGPVYASEDCTMTGKNGMSYSLKAGWNNDLPTIDSGWTGADVYRLTPGVTYFGNFMYSIESDAAPVQGALMITSGSEVLTVSSNGTYVYDGKNAHYATKTGTDGETGTSEYDLFKMSVVPQNRDDKVDVDITSLLIYYGKLNNKVNDTVSAANRNARTVWSIYDDAGSASMYLSTLNVPDTYEDVKLTDVQKKMLVSLYMDQLATWWKDNDHEIKKDNYRLTQDSMSLYCRGNLTMQGDDGTGKTQKIVYEDVAFTPIFYKTTDLRTGTNTLSSYAYVMVYGKCTSLSTFDLARYEDCSIICLGPGSTIGIAEMRYDGKQVQDVNLKASQVDYIHAEKIEDYDPLPPIQHNDMDELIRLIFFVLGGAFLLWGFGRGHPVATVLGLIIVMAGLFLAEPIESLLERFNITFEWPR